MNVMDVLLEITATVQCVESLEAVTTGGGRGKKGKTMRSMTKPQLLELAKRLGIRGRSKMVREDLERAIRSQRRSLSRAARPGRGKPPRTPF